jgi:hypothetical protein
MSLNRIATLLVALASFLLFSTAHGQVTSDVNNNTSRPIPGAGHDYIKMLTETVNPSSGSLSLRIQAPTPPGRGGISYPFAFAYDSNGVQHLSSDGLGYPANPPDPFFLSNGGWSYAVPMLSSMLVTWESSQPPDRCTFYKDFIFQDAVGGRHSLGLALVENPNSRVTCSPVSAHGIIRHS